MSEEIGNLVPVGLSLLVRQSFDTPRTDAADRQSCHFLTGDRYLEMRDTARDLERELCELRELAAQLLQAKGRFHTQKAFEDLREFISSENAERSRNRPRGR